MRLLFTLFFTFLIARLFGNDYKHNFGLSCGPMLNYAISSGPVYPDIGYNLQLNYCFMIKPKHGLQFNLSYMTKGYRFSNSFLTNELGENSVKLFERYRHDYLVIHFLYKLVLGDKIKFSGSLGPFLAFNIGNYKKYPYSKMKWVSSSKVQAVDIGLAFSLGSIIPIYKGLDFNFCIQNDLGHVNIAQSNFLSKNTFLFNSSLLIGFNYRFGSFQK